MKLAVVTGYVVCTVRHEGLAHDKLLMVEMLNARGEPDGNVRSPSTASARDAESGYCWSAAARRGQAHAHGASPVDLCVIGIVDEAAADGQVLFHK
ncbi:detox protein [Klebsiella pneumoniae]|uniref:Detox protein n=1 Tax=Klebsiella pneumoniae TaxID=573 RepID=A0A377V5X5_KLEPN|nr:detox protein [Klebsiella pneumoniae]